MSRGLSKKKRAEKLAEKLTERPVPLFNWTGVLTIPNRLPPVPNNPIILGSGPRAKGRFNEFDENDFIIGVNGAVTAPEVHKTAFKIAIWFVQDPLVVDKDWFPKADKEFKGIRIFSKSAAVKTKSFLNGDGRNYYVFDIITVEMAAREWKPPQWRFRTDVTGSGSALWLPFIIPGINRARLLGVDMFGPGYHDDTINKRKSDIKEWPQISRFEQQIDWMTNHGFLVESISETALRNVPPAVRIHAPKRVYIVAPGPKGEKHLKRIPKGSYVMVVNGMGALWRNYDLPWTPEAWLAADKDAVYKDYWEEAYYTFPGQRFFSNEISLRATSKGGKSKCKEFLADINFPIDTINGFWFRSAGYVVGVGLWLCYLDGVKEVVFVGADLSGNTYAGGGKNPDKRWEKEHGKIWKGRDVLDDRIRYCKQRGMKVYSMSETTLREVEMI